MSEKTAAMIVVGDEILSGKVEETNSLLARRELRALGVRLKGIFVIPDELDTIAEMVRSLHGRYTFLITSGGVGPTHDDMTMAGIARGLGRRLVTSEELLADIAKIYGERLTPAAAKMADLPEGAELIREVRLQVPVVKVEEIHIFPGEPSFFTQKFLAIRERFRSTPFHLACIFTTLGETELATRMEHAQERFQVAVGSYPVYDNPEYRVQITVESKDLEPVRAAFAYILEAIPEEARVRVDVPW